MADGHLLGEHEEDNAMEVFMSLAMTIFSMIAAWLAIACAMLWGVLRISRRHVPVEPRTWQATYRPLPCRIGAYTAQQTG